jgi:hypothetical protein
MRREQAMTYSCTDFADTILDALKIDLEPDEYDDPSAQADKALGVIKRLKDTLNEAADWIDPDETEDPAGAVAFIGYLRNVASSVNP